MKRVRAAVAGITVAALTVGVAAPAGAQEEPEALGFAVDKTQAQPGALVLGKADPADIAEHCVTDLEGFEARFAELFNGPFAGGDISGELFERIFPTGPQIEDLDQTSYLFFVILLLGLGAIFGSSPGTEDALAQTFVMTFADIATQEPVGERSNFDPATGEGSVVVPDIEPGLWAVAATCVGPSFDIDVLEAGIRAFGDFLQGIGFPVGDPTLPEGRAFMQEFLDSDATGLDLLLEFFTEVGPTMLEPIMVPDALGAVLFCVLDAEGNCPDGRVAPPPGEPVPQPTGEPTPAEPVVAVPAFTG